jgi:hypothetical protein
MKKIVINRCFGGFGLSALGYKRYAELKGKRAYFFTHYNKNDNLDMDSYYPVSVEKANSEFIFNVFTIPNPQEILKGKKDWHLMTLEEKKEYNKLYHKYSLYAHDFKRDDPILIKVIEELGEKANGRFAELKIVEIPDNVDWEIDEYDGNETIDEVHKSWD